MIWVKYVQHSTTWHQGRIKDHAPSPQNVFYMYNHLTQGRNISLINVHRVYWSDAGHMYKDPIAAQSWCANYILRSRASIKTCSANILSMLWCAMVPTPTVSGIWTAVWPVIDDAVMLPGAQPISGWTCAGWMTATHSHAYVSKHITACCECCFVYAQHQL